jgi:hypothetical protein
MKNRLDEFIRNNRDAMDNREPSDRVWIRIRESLFGKQLMLSSVGFWRAAAVLFMGISVYLIAVQVFEKKDSGLALREFNDVETFYAHQIAEKVELIESFNGGTGLNGFTHDFQQLEAMYQVLKEEMNTRPSEKVKDALVLNLLVRIDLLNQQLHKIEKTESVKQDESKTTV